MVGAARLLVIVADHSKWGVVGLSSFARLDQADILITDAGLDPAARDQLAATTRRLIVVEVASPPELEVG
jgi:DeoR/GlpR family transcriptional regulator of sugar metabolism